MGALTMLRESSYNDLLDAQPGWLSGETPLHQDVLRHLVGTTPEPEEGSKSANPKQHYGDKKLPLHLVPLSFVSNVCIALYEGMRKYGLVNWRASKVEAMTYVAAQERHIRKWVNGERCDPVTRVPHLASAAACLCIIMDAEINGSLIDDRPMPCANIDQMISDLETTLAHLRMLYADKSPKHYQLRDEK